MLSSSELNDTWTFMSLVELSPFGSSGGDQYISIPSLFLPSAGYANSTQILYILSVICNYTK